MFVNDLLLFNHGDCVSIKVLKACLSRFSEFSNLQAQPSKSDYFVCCFNLELHDELVRESRFHHGFLPILYLGIPLISKKLSYSDYHFILDPVRSRVGSWQGRLLSFASRLELI